MITIKSKVKEIVENPEALAVVKSVMPAFDETNPGMKQAYGMSLKALLAFPATKCPKPGRCIAGCGKNRTWVRGPFH